jgi:outer membrane lipoprotein LolB
VYTLSAPNRETEQAKDPDQLTEQILGWRLPMRGLPYWLRGRPQPDEPADADPKEGAPSVLHQAGWSIEYQSRYPDSGLPERLVLAREDLQIRLILTNWDTR